VKNTARARNPAPPVRAKAVAPRETTRLLGDIRALIESARQHTAQAVNAGLVTLYWSIGARIRKDILKEKRADYGEQIVATLSRQLTAEYGRGFTRTNLFYMVQFAEAFPDQRIVHALSGQLSWTHFRQIISIEDSLKRDFYAEMCRIERWSTRALRRKIGTMLFERTALAKKPEEVVKQEIKALRDEDKVTPDLVFRDPYEHVELLQLAPSGIRVAEYLTELPPRDLLERKLHDALRNARAALAARRAPNSLPKEIGTGR